MTLDITHGHLLPCTCNDSPPDQTFASPPETHWCSCDACGALIFGDTAEEAALRWNDMVRDRRGLAA